MKVVVCLLAGIILLASDRIDAICVINASGDKTCAEKIFTPRTLKQLQAAIKQAIKDGKKIRAFGGLHSQIGDVKVGKNNYLINMNSLDKIFEIDFHKSTIQVQGGVTLHRLSQELAKAGFELIDQPGPYDVIVGGMSANGAHESGKHGCVPDSLLALEIVDGQGNLRKISAENDPEIFKAARVSLGVLGPIYSATFQCKPGTKRRVFAEVSTAKFITDNIHELLNNNDNFQFLVDPISQVALLETFNITQKNVPNTSNRDFAHYFPQSAAIGDLNTVANPLIPVSLYQIVNNGIVTGGVVDIIEFFYKGYSYFHANAVSRGRINEISVEAKFLPQALQALFDVATKFKNNGKEFITFAEVRFVSDKNFSYLSATNRPSWLIGFLVIQPNDTPDAIEMLREFYHACLKFNGRPQWGNNPEFLKFDQTLKLYGKKNVEAFQKVRKNFDPNGIFYTPYFVQRLGPI